MPILKRSEVEGSNGGRGQVGWGFGPKKQAKDSPDGAMQNLVLNFRAFENRLRELRFRRFGVRWKALTLSFPTLQKSGRTELTAPIYGRFEPGPLRPQSQNIRLKRTALSP